MCVLDRLCVIGCLNEECNCDVCTVRGHACSVCLTVCVVFTPRTMVHVYCVQLCAQCVGFVA